MMMAMVRMMMLRNSKQKPKYSMRIWSKQTTHTSSKVKITRYSMFNRNRDGHDIETKVANIGDDDNMTMMTMKMTSHSSKIPFSERMLPWLLQKEEVKVLHLVRDPRSNSYVSKSVFVIGGGSKVKSLYLCWNMYLHLHFLSVWKSI